MRPRTNVYIDGFNLYYGLKKRAEAKGLHGPEYRWLNIDKLAQFLLPDSSINHIRYFTAMVMDWPDDPTKSQRQLVFLRALATLPRVSVYLGQFKEKKMRLPLADPPPNGSRFCEVLWSEEKGSDVNLATMLLVDAYEGDCERAAIISNDSDLALAIEHAKTKLEHGVVVFNPHPGRNARKLQQVATEYRRIKERALRAAVFPDRLRDANGEFVKPASW